MSASTQGKMEEMRGWQPTVEHNTHGPRYGKGSPKELSSRKGECAPNRQGK